MGGNIAWTIRLSDGTEYRMERWTNIFPDITIEKPFLREEPEAIEEAVQTWKEMADDWHQNKDTGQYQYGMTSVYAPYPGLLAPSAYGFIVTDFINKTIVTCTDYTSIGAIYLTEHYLRLLKDTTEDSPFREKFERLKEAHAERRVRRLVGMGDDIEVTGDEPFDALLKTAIKQGKFIATIDLPYGWKVEDINSDRDRQEAFARVQELGFNLTDEERRGFQEWIAELDEEEEE